VWPKGRRAGCFGAEGRELEDQEHDLSGFISQGLQGEINVDKLIFCRAYSHVVAGWLPLCGPPDSLAQLPLDFF
jgi:hypothetical protein